MVFPTCYVQRKGLGKHLLSLLELVARKQVRAARCMSRAARCALHVALLQRMEAVVIPYCTSSAFRAFADARLTGYTDGAPCAPPSLHLFRNGQAHL